MTESMLSLARDTLNTLTENHSVDVAKAERADTVPRDGYIPLCIDGGETYVFVRPDEMEEFLDSMGARPGAVSAARLFRARSELGRLQDLAADADVACDIDERLAVSDPEAFVKKVDDVLVAIEGKTGTMPDLEDSEADDLVKVAISFLWDDAGFHCYAYVNFDAPYYRSVGEKRRDAGGDALTLDGNGEPVDEIVLGEYSGTPPESVGEFADILDGVLERAFPSSKPVPARRVLEAAADAAAEGPRA